jgi:hypothetical protein
MSVLYRTDRKRQRPRLTTDAEGRLPRGRALLVIAALSALSWVVLIALFMAIRSPALQLHAGFASDSRFAPANQPAADDCAATARVSKPVQNP